MLRVIVGILIVLHGLVHMLYFGQSRRLFELQPGMTWPDGSWAFSTLLGDDATRSVAGATCVLAAIGFVVGGVAVLLGQGWWRSVVVGAAALSVALYVLMWDGSTQALDDQGGVGILINAALLVAILVVGWPRLGF